MKGAIAATALVCAVCFAASALAAGPVEGAFKANGKDAKLGYVIAKKGEPFSGNPTVTLVFSEKDASKDPKPDMHAQFGDLGDALVIRLMNENGKYTVIGSEFAHSALKHSGASASGVVDIKDAAVANGELSGHLVTGPDAKIFSEPIAVDLRFHVKQP